MLVASPEEMMRLGESFAAEAERGDVFCLAGELGAGKTTFVRGFLVRLGHESDVRSPTFNLVNLYQTEPPVCHADLYRLEGAAQLPDTGVADYFESHVVVIEWPELARHLLPANATWIHIEFADNGREVRIERGER